MKVVFSDKQLRFRFRAGSVRPAFTLVELVVSIGILLLMLSLAGQVFSVTVKSTGQATALTRVNQRLRQFERILRDDLRNVQPGLSMILIQGNSVNAYWTQEGREADGDGDPSNGYPHASDPERERARGNAAGPSIPVKPRADLLMIFTARKARSYTNPAVTSNLQQVVYGHAELGEYVPNPNPTGPHDQFTLVQGPTAFPNVNGYPDATAVSPIPSEHWHLARRSVLLLPTGPPPRPRCPNLPMDFLDDACLLDGRTDFIGTPPNCNPVQPFLYCTYEESALLPATDDFGKADAFWPWFLPEIFGDTRLPWGDPARHQPFARSLLDATPPPLYADSLSHFMLPHCASFKVEWALNPRSDFVAGRLDGAHQVFWFDPGDEANPAVPGDVEDPLQQLQKTADALILMPPRTPQNALGLKLTSLLDDQSVQADGRRYALVDRFRRDPDINAWQQIDPGGRANLAVFTANRPHRITGEPVPDDIFPGALRITIDLFDDARRLGRPIRRVFVVPVGR